MAEEEVRLLCAQGLCMVDKSAIICLRIPEATGLTAPPKRTGLWDGIVQLACARVGDVSDTPRTGIEEVALDPRGEIRTYGAHDSARYIPQTQRASADRFSSFVLFSKPCHDKKSTR